MDSEDQRPGSQEPWGPILDNSPGRQSWEFWNGLRGGFIVTGIVMYVTAAIIQNYSQVQGFEDLGFYTKCAPFAVAEVAGVVVFILWKARKVGTALPRGLAWGIVLAAVLACGALGILNRGP